MTDAAIESELCRHPRGPIVGFAFTELLGFKLLTRLKHMGSMRLHDLAGTDRETTKVSMLTLHLPQSSPVLINTLMLQTILEDQEFHDMLTSEDRQGLTPLFWTHIAPYGRLTLDIKEDLAERVSERRQSNSRSETLRHRLDHQRRHTCRRPQPGHPRRAHRTRFHSHKQQHPQ